MERGVDRNHGSRIRVEVGDELEEEDEEDEDIMVLDSRPLTVSISPSGREHPVMDYKSKSRHEGSNDSDKNQNTDKYKDFHYRRNYNETTGYEYSSGRNTNGNRNIVADRESVFDSVSSLFRNLVKSVKEVKESLLPREGHQEGDTSPTNHHIPLLNIRTNTQKKGRKEKRKKRKRKGTSKRIRKLNDIDLNQRRANEEDNSKLEGEEEGLSKERVELEKGGDGREGNLEGGEQIYFEDIDDDNSESGEELTSSSEEEDDRLRRKEERKDSYDSVHDSDHDNGLYNGKSFPDSQNYEPEESYIWRIHQDQRNVRDEAAAMGLGCMKLTEGQLRALKRWALTFLIGIMVGLVAVVVTGFTHSITDAKFAFVNSLMEKESEIYLGFSLIMFVFINLCYALIAYTCVWFEPVSMGSGIPEIKCFLNGIILPRVVRIKTLICKMVGVTFTVASGFPAGKEGPMVHAGSVIAAGISQGKSKVFGVSTNVSAFLQDFRNDREKRDFVSCGAAAGVAAAFGAPIGGVLFSLEEGASFWSPKLTYRAFFCAIITVSFLMIFESYEIKLGQPDSTQMFSFGHFFSLDASLGNYNVWELFMFLLLGIFGGLIGALFNHTNKKITIWRMQHRTSTSSKLKEVMMVNIIMSLVSYILPMLWRKCTPIPTEEQLSDWTEQEKKLIGGLVRFQCEEGQYNELASLYFTDADTAIKQLFHYRELGSSETDQEDYGFSSWALILFFSTYITMAVVTYGICVPSGLFVPSLLSGAAFGRLWGNFLHNLDHTQGTFADSGTYALIGAAAVLGGMARMTISLTVILLEATGDMQYVIPLMLTLIAARWTGNAFNDGLYDIHIHLKQWPLLEADMKPVKSKRNLCANDIASKPVQCLSMICNVGVAFDLLRNTEHDCFPVIYKSDINDTSRNGKLKISETSTNEEIDDVQIENKGGQLIGTVLRKALTVIIEKKAFSAPILKSSGPLSSTSESLNLDANGYNHGAYLNRTYNKSMVNSISSSTFSPSSANQIYESIYGTEKKHISPVLAWSTLESYYPKYPNINNLEITELQRDTFIDLRPFINTAPYVIHESASLEKTYRFFRTMGLRHLCVVNKQNAVTGIITRSDLVDEVITPHH